MSTMPWITGPVNKKLKSFHILIRIDSKSSTRRSSEMHFVNVEDRVAKLEDMFMTMMAYQHKRDEEMYRGSTQTKNVEDRVERLENMFMTMMSSQQKRDEEMLKTHREIMQTEQKRLNVEMQILKQQQETDRQLIQNQQALLKNQEDILKMMGLQTALDRNSYAFDHPSLIKWLEPYYGRPLTMLSQLGEEHKWGSK